MPDHRARDTERHQGRSMIRFLTVIKRCWTAFYAAFMAVPQSSYGFLRHRTGSVPGRARILGADSMLDSVMLVLGSGAFALFLAYVMLCANL
jgi:hypothetical protein